MKKISLLVLPLLLLIPLKVLGIENPKVLTLSANNESLEITYNGTVEAESHAVMCKLYNSSDEEIDLLSLSVDNNSFSGSFTVPDYGSYTVACANYEGGEIKKTEISVVKEKFTVTFNSNGGSAIAPIEVEDGSVVAKPNDPVNGNMIFDGWHEDETLTKAFDFQTKITKNITLYAGWLEPEKEKHTVSFNTNGGNEIESVKISDGDVVIRPEDPENGNKIFDGWYEDETLTKVFNFQTKITENVTLYAKWSEPEKEKFTVTFNSNGGSKITDQVVEIEDNAKRPENPTKEGYTFDDWYEDETLTKLFSFERGILENTTLYARWIEDESAKVYTVSDDSGNSISFREEEGQTFTVEIVEYTSMTDAERSELGIEKEVYDSVKEVVIEATKKEGTLLGFYDIVVKNGLGNEKHSGNFDIKIKLTDEMKKYKSFKMIYLKDDFTTETPVELKLVDGYLVGTLPHLSAYVLVGNTNVNSPATGDNIYIWIATLFISIIGLIFTVVTAIKIKKAKAN